MISGPQTVEAPYFNASSRKGSVPHLTIGAKHHLPFANMDVARSRAMFDDITEWFSLGIGKSSSTWQCHAALGRTPVLNTERVDSQPPQVVIFVSVTSIRLHALRQQAMATRSHPSIYGGGMWVVVGPVVVIFFFAKKK